MVNRLINIADVTDIASAIVINIAPSFATMEQKYNGIFSHLNELCKMSIPMFATAIIQEISFFVTMLFVGHVGEGVMNIGAATLGNMMCNFSGYSIAYGMCAALDTLCSQAYGAKSYLLVGLYCQRAMLILSLCCAIFGAVWWNTSFILHYFLRIDKDTAQLAGLWSRIMMLGLWPAIMFEVLRKFLQCQQLYWPIVVSMGLSGVFNIFFGYLFTHIFKFGLSGCAYAFVISQWISFLSVVFFIAIRKILYFRSKSTAQQYTELDRTDHPIATELNGQSNGLNGDEFQSYLVNGGDIHIDTEIGDPEDNWPTYSYDVFYDWCYFLKLGVPAAASLFIEWGSFELASGIVGQLGRISLAAHGIFVSTAVLLYMSPFSVSLSAATIAGSYLGAGEHVKAKNVICLGMWIVFGIGILGAVGLWYYGSYWALIFTSDHDVLAMIAEVLPVMALYVLVDNTKCVMVTILRSTGRPEITVWGNAVACVVFMLPLGWLMALRCHMGLAGVWLAMCCAWSITACSYFVIILRTDWQAQSILAMAHTKSGESRRKLSTNSLNTLELVEEISSVQDDDANNDNDNDEVVVIIAEDLHQPIS